MYRPGAVEQLGIDTGEAWTHRPLEEDDIARLVSNELDWAPADLARLRFIRWLVENGKLTEQLA